MKIISTAKRFWIGLLLAFSVLFLLDLSLGSVSIPTIEIIKVLVGSIPSQPIWKEIILNFRLTKSLTCAFAGGALAIGGLQMQTLFRNPLAGPDVFGLSSGASLAVSLIFMASGAGISTFNSSSPWIVAFFASIGSGMVAIIVLSISGRVRDNVSLLIVGIMIGAFASSIVSVLQYMSRAEEQQAYLMWTFGNVGGLNWKEISVLGIVVVIGQMLAALTIKPMNAWMLGDAYAKSLGVNLIRSRLIIIISTSILTGVVTAFCGPIAFVGLAVPHLTKLLINTTNHRILLPAVMIAGASLMLLCDILTQLPGNARVLPINAITSLVGAPVVIWVIMRGRKIST